MTTYRNNVIGFIPNFCAENGTTTLNHSSNIDIKVSCILRQLGIGSHINGYYYIKTAVEMVIDNEEYGYLITKRMYPDIAKKYGITSSRIERSIRHAIKSMSCNDVIKATYLGCAKEKYTNKEFIMALVELIKFNMQ